MKNTKVKIILLVIAAFSLIGIVSGCSAPGSTSGFTPPGVQTASDIQKRIDQVKADPSIPANAKAIALSNLQKQLSQAK